LVLLTLFSWMLLIPANSVRAQAPTDEVFQEIERQIKQQEAEQAEAKKKAEAEARQKAEDEAKRKVEEERLRVEQEEKQKLEEEIRRKLEEEQRMAAEEAKRKEEEAKQKAAAPAGIEFVDIPGGSFQMGSDTVASQQPVHTVTLQPFKLGKYEVTQAQWRTVMGDNPSSFQGCDNCPVESVSWEDVQGFIQKLNQQTGGHYRLPSEAEWEYACRSGGKPEEYCGGNSPEALAWYTDNSGNKTHPVGQKSANGLGLYDMSGNVWEWTQDCWNESYNGAPADGSAWQSGDCGQRVGRGGSWSGTPGWIRSANRARDAPGGRGDGLGFRLVQDL